MNDNLEVINLEKNNNEVWLYGIKGWLLAFVIFLILASLFQLNLVVPDLLYLGYRIKHWQVRYVILRSSMQIINIFFPIFTAYQIFRLKKGALLTARVYLYWLPFASFAWSFLFDRFFFDFWTALQVSFIMPGVIISLPWLLYLSSSRRVTNTFLFLGKYLPKRIECPFCLSKLLLDKEEQLKMEMNCPNCNNLISSKSISGLTSRSN